MQTINASVDQSNLGGSGTKKPPLGPPSGYVINTGRAVPDTGWDFRPLFDFTSAQQTVATIVDQQQIGPFDAGFVLGPQNGIAFFSPITLAQFYYSDACYFNGGVNNYDNGGGLSGVVPGLGTGPQIGPAVPWGYTWSNEPCKYLPGQSPAPPNGDVSVAMSYNNNGKGNFGGAYGITGLDNSF